MWVYIPASSKICPLKELKYYVTLKNIRKFRAVYFQRFKLRQKIQLAHKTNKQINKPISRSRIRENAGISKIVQNHCCQSLKFNLILPHCSYSQVHGHMALLAGNFRFPLLPSCFRLSGANQKMNRFIFGNKVTHTLELDSYLKCC